MAHRLRAIDVIDLLMDVFILRGVPGTHPVRHWARVRRQGAAGLDRAVGARTACIALESLWANGSVESVNARLRDELVDGAIFHTLKKEQIVIESWRRPYNVVRPHVSLGCKPPAPGDVPSRGRSGSMP